MTEKTVCLECYNTITSRFTSLLMVKELYHLRREHPDLYNRAMSLGPDSVVSRQKVGERYFMGDLLQYEDDDGSLNIQIHLD